MTDNESEHDPADAPPSNDSLKSQTLRISLDSVRPLKSPLTAKKTTRLVSDIPEYAGPIPQTIRLKRPPTSPITVQPVDLPPPAKKAGDTALMQTPFASRSANAETLKRQTARIEPAESAAPRSTAEFKRTTGPISGIPMHAGPIPQTIRLKRPPTSPVITKPSEPVAMPRGEQAARGSQEITEAPTIVKNIAAPKAPTSRVVLEERPAPVAATAKQPTAKIPPALSAEPSAPKTIRLKRPSTLNDAEEAIQGAAAQGSLRTAKKGETAKIDLPVEDSALTPITQRKTIKIKRTDRAVMPSPATPEAAAAPQPGNRAEALSPAPKEDETLVFPLVACAATICIAALVYIMVAQAFGVHMLLPSAMQLH